MERGGEWLHEPPSTNQRSIALRRNCGLASWEEFELTVQSQLSAVFSFPLTETAGCVMKCGCPERWLPSLHTSWLTAHSCQCPGARVASVSGRGNQVSLPCWLETHSHSWLLFQRRRVWGAAEPISASSHSTWQGLRRREEREWAEQSLWKRRWAPRILQTCGADQTKLSWSRTWGKRRDLLSKPLGWTLTPHPHPNAHFD